MSPVFYKKCVVIFSALIVVAGSAFAAGEAVSNPSPTGNAYSVPDSVSWDVDGSYGCEQKLYFNYGSGSEYIETVSGAGGEVSVSVDTSRINYGETYTWELVDANSVSACNAGPYDFDIISQNDQVSVDATGPSNGKGFVGDPSSVDFSGDISTDNGAPSIPDGTYDLIVDGTSVASGSVTDAGTSFSLSHTDSYSEGSYTWNWKYTGGIDGTTDESLGDFFTVESVAENVGFSDFSPEDFADSTDRTETFFYDVTSDYEGSVELYVDNNKEDTTTHFGDGFQSFSHTLGSKQGFGSYDWYVKYIADKDSTEATSSTYNYDLNEFASIILQNPSSSSTFNTGETIDVEYDYEVNLDGTVTTSADDKGEINSESVSVGSSTDYESGTVSFTTSYSNPGTYTITPEFSASSESYTDSDSVTIDVVSDASTFDVTYQSPDDGAVLYEKQGFDFKVSNTQSGSVAVFVDGTQVDSFNHPGGTASYSSTYEGYDLGSHNWYVKYFGDDGSSSTGNTQNFELKTTDFIQNASVSYQDIGGTLSKTIRLDLRGDAAISSKNSITGANTVRFNSDEWVLDGFSDTFSDTFVVGDGAGHTDSWNMDFDVGLGNIKPEPGIWNLSTQRLNRDINVVNNGNQSLYNLSCANNGYQNVVSGTTDVNKFAEASSSFEHICKWQGDYITESISAFNIEEEQIVLSSNYSASKEVGLTEDVGVDWVNNLDIAESVNRPFKCSQINNSLSGVSAGSSNNSFTGYNCNPGEPGTLSTGMRQEDAETVVSLNVTGAEVYTDKTQNKDIIRKIDKNSAPLWDSKILSSTDAFTNDINQGVEYTVLGDIIQHITTTSFGTSSSLTSGLYDLKINYTANKPPKYKNVTDNVSSKVEQGDYVNISGYWKDDESSLDLVYLSTNETGKWINYSEDASRSVAINPSTGVFERVDFNWRNNTVGNKYVCWKQWGNDTNGDYNSTNTKCFNTYVSYEEENKNEISILDTGIGFKFFDEGFSDTLSIATETSRAVDYVRAKTEDIGVGSTLARTFDSSVDVVQSIIVQNSASNNQVLKGNFNQDISVSTVASSQPLPQARTVRVWDENYERLNRAEGGENIHVMFNGTHTDGRSELSTANITLKRPDGSVAVDSKNMTVVQDISKGYEYKFDYSTPDSVNTAGSWSIEIGLYDKEGIVDTNSTEFVLQTSDVSVTEPVQESVNIFSDVPYSKDITIRNPSDTEFTNTDIRISMPKDTIEESIVLEDELRADVPFGGFIGQGYIEHTLISLEPDEVIEYVNEYDVEGLDIQESNTTESEDEKRIQEIEFNMSTVGETDFEDLTHQFSLRNPEQVTSASLIVNGTDRTVDEGYEFRLSDTDNDRLGDRVSFNVPEVNNRIDYKVEVVRGEPLGRDTETIMRNPPATTTKLIEWRKGLRFSNPNNFATSVNRKVRVPLRASNIVFENSIIDKRFDDRGSYVPLSFELEPNSNATAFYEYNTPAIDIATLRNTPNVNWINKDVEEQVNVTFENPYPNNISEAQYEVNILSGSNLVTKVGEDVVDEKSVVEGTYLVDVENIPANGQKVAQITYNIPIGNITYDGNQNVSSGNTLEVYSIKSEAPVSRPNTWFEVDGSLSDSDYNCIQTERVYNIQTNNTIDFRCGSKVDGANSKLSTVVELNTLGPNDNLRIGVEHRPYRPVVDDAFSILVVFGNNLFFLGIIMLSVVTGTTAYRRYGDEEKINSVLARFN